MESRNSGTPPPNAKKPLHKRLRAVVCTAVLVALLSAAATSADCRRFAYAVARLTLIELLRVWDWRIGPDRECLLRNPLAEGGELSSDDCKKCANATAVHYLRGITRAHFSWYLSEALPAVVMDASQSWPALELFNERFLLEIFEKNEKLATKKLVSCHAASNVIRNSANVKYILNRVVRHALPSWYAFWENCDVEAAKMMRSYYERPYFIPEATELLKTNWIFMSHNFTHQEDTPISIDAQMVWLAQIRGTVDVWLLPQHPCSGTCQELPVSLKAGEILTYTTDLWEAVFRPPDSEELSISLATGGTFT